MGVQIQKNGVFSAYTINESEAMNLMTTTNSLTHTPGTGSNSCKQLNILQNKNMVIEEGQKYVINLDITWSGFDKSNTSGTFYLSTNHMWTDSSGTNRWSPANLFTKAILNEVDSFGALVLSADSGFTHITCTTEAMTTDMVTAKAIYISLRSDYSNGVGTITLSNIKIIPEKYYTTDTIQSGSSMKIGSDSIVARELYEL